MKLDKIKFAVLINYIGRQFAITLSNAEMHDIDDIIDIDVPEANCTSGEDVNRLMALMTEGTRKIEAIKVYRNITSCGLKESKDAVEMYWVNKPAYNANYHTTDRSFLPYK